MSPRANVKPLTHWAISKNATLRFTQRDPALVRGALRLPEGAFAFTYDPVTRTLTLEGRDPVILNEYGWEVNL
jgi:hypothetical protein